MTDKEVNRQIIVKSESHEIVAEPETIYIRSVHSSVKIRYIDGVSHKTGRKVPKSFDFDEKLFNKDYRITNERLSKAAKRTIDVLDGRL
ncbi:MAG: hypothetical protein Q4Q53_05815 [Methanocorpusculum sp.]|nr:hypothetical protein [Methanocorpusculum sp.]